MNGGGAGMGEDGPMYPLPPPPMMATPQPHGQTVRAAGNHQHQHQQRRPAAANNWADNDANTLLVVATLITTLTYQLGSSIPGGYWQDTQLPEDGKRPHTAGDPVMRDLHPQRLVKDTARVPISWSSNLSIDRSTASLLLNPSDRSTRTGGGRACRYWVFMVASWMGFAGSMLMTLSLLVRMPVDSRHVRWSFAVAYSSLVLTFRLSQPKTHISLDILIWVAVTAFLWLMISVRTEHRARIVHLFCCTGDN